MIAPVGEASDGERQPIQAASDLSAMSSSRRSGADAPNLIMLIVEPDNQIRGQAARVLCDAGYGVLEASSGIQAFVTFELNPQIGLICTDLCLPDFDGYKLADVAKLRRPLVRIVYTGAIPLARDKLGVVHGPILEKPYSPCDLAGVVRRLLHSV